MRAPRKPPTVGTWKVSLAIVCFLIFSTVLAYLPVAHFDFVDFDDTDYVTQNAAVQAGLTVRSMVWAFAHPVACIWHPVTLLSFMLDSQFFHLNAGAYHLTNLAFHTVNTVLLFLLLQGMTGARWRSAAVAALFALHPLHVESVAWVAERKDVLSTFFWLLSLGAYWRYTQGRQEPIGKVQAPGFKSQVPSARAQTSSHKAKVWFYWLALLAFILGLLSKPMLVTLPFTLLLLDYWPLRRFAFAEPPGAGNTVGRILPLVVEKIPFFLLSVAVCFITFAVQQRGGAVNNLAAVSFYSRIGNGLVTYVLYLVRIIWPENLCGLYLRTGEWPVWQVAGAALFLVAVTVLVLWATRRHGYLASGWFWYLGTLVPVIGLVTVGQQTMADRYTYVPLIGIFIMMAWGGLELATAWRIPKPALGVVTGLGLLGCLMLTHLQIGYWKNSETLYLRMIAVSDRNYVAQNNLGIYYANHGRLDEAVSRSQSALYLKPNYGKAYINLGSVALKRQRYGDAIGQYQAALQSNPDPTDQCAAYNGLGTAYAWQNQLTEAAGCFSQALRLKPDDPSANDNLGNILAMQNQWEEAKRHYLTALAANPLDAQANFNLGNVLVLQGRRDEAEVHYREALRLNPDYFEARKALQVLEDGH